VKKSQCLLFIVSLFYAGCAGREAKPISVYQKGDENKSCEELKTEIAQLQADMIKILPKTDKTGTNALWAAGGVVCIVPIFFMDLKDAEKVEFEAMRQRHNELLDLAAEKNCDMTGIRAEKINSAKEEKARVKAEAKAKAKNK